MAGGRGRGWAADRELDARATGHGHRGRGGDLHPDPGHPVSRLMHAARAHRVRRSTLRPAPAICVSAYARAQTCGRPPSAAGTSPPRMSPDAWRPSTPASTAAPAETGVTVPRHQHLPGAAGPDCPADFECLSAAPSVTVGSLATPSLVRRDWSHGRRVSMRGWQRSARSTISGLSVTGMKTEHVESDGADCATTSEGSGPFTYDFTTNGTVSVHEDRSDGRRRTVRARIQAQNQLEI